jgi:hypothetical protein
MAGSATSDRGAQTDCLRLNPAELFEVSEDLDDQGKYPVKFRNTN